MDCPSTGQRFVYGLTDEAWDEIRFGGDKDAGMGTQHISQHGCAGSLIANDEDRSFFGHLHGILPESSLLKKTAS
jgi:hypothetical protein